MHNYDVQQHRAGQIISPLSFQTSPASHVTIQNQSTNGRYNRVMKTLPDRSSGSHHRLCFRSGTCHHARCSSGAHHTAFHCYPMETTYTHKHTHTHLGLPGQPGFLVTSVIPRGEWCKMFAWSDVLPDSTTGISRQTSVFLDPQRHESEVLRNGMLLLCTGSSIPSHDLHELANHIPST